MTISSIFQANNYELLQTGSEDGYGDTWTDTENNVTIPKNVLNLNVSSIYSAFRILIVVNVDATQDTSETFDLLGTYDGANWSMSQNSVQSIGGGTNVVFSIDSSGQIKYTSTPATAGFTKRVFKWLKRTL